MLLLVASACGPKLVSSNTTTTIKKEWRDTLVTAVVVRPEFKINVDTTINKLAPCVDKPIIIKKTNDKGKLSMQIMIDSLGRITGDFISKEDSLKAELNFRVQKETIYKDTIKVYEEREKWWKSLIRKAAVGVIGVLVVAGLALYVYKKVLPF